MSSALLISIHPRFVEKILSGQKVFEYRKTLPSRTATHLAIYATSPVKKIVAVAEIEDCRSGSPSSVWQQTFKGSGISRAYFRHYFFGRDTANAFQLGKVFKLKTPVPLSAIDANFVAPQSYRFLNDAVLQLIQHHLEKTSCTHDRLIFLGGIHGVGKSTLCNTVFLPFGYFCTTASKIIEGTGSVVADKKVANIDDNQGRLLRNLSRLRAQHARFVLDGHFTLITTEGNVEPISLDVFRKIKPATLVLLTRKPAEIVCRLRARDGKDWKIPFIEVFQEAEKKCAENVASELKIPLHIVDNKENPFKIMDLIHRGLK